MSDRLACIDIGGTALKTGVCDTNGELMDTDTLPVHQQKDSLIEEIDTWMSGLKKKHKIIGLAISAPGAVDRKTGVIGGGSAIPCLHGPAWIDIFQKKFNMPVSIENDANCAALAEVIFGNGKSYRDMAFIVCGTGIGGAVVIDKKIHYGSHLYGGEFGCMAMRDENGRVSTFSTQASTMSFVRKIQRLYPQDTWNGKKVFAEAENGNRDCIRVIDVFFANLAEGIYNVQHVYDPEIILLGGGISSRKDFIPRLKEKLSILVQRISEETCTRVVLPHISGCSFGNNANLIGAAAHWMQQNGYL